MYEYIVCQKKAHRKQIRAYEDQKIMKVKLAEKKIELRRVEKFLAFERLDSGVLANASMKKQRNPIMLQGDDVGMEVRTDRQSVFQEKDDLKSKAY